MTEKALYSATHRSLINWLKTNRLARNVTMRTVARRLGVSHTWIAKTESGERRLEVNEYVDLCFALGLDPHQGLNLVIADKSSYANSVYPLPNAAEPAPHFRRKRPS